MHEKRLADEALPAHDCVAESQRFGLIEEDHLRSSDLLVQVLETVRAFAFHLQGVEEGPVRREVILERPLAPAHDEEEPPDSDSVELLEYRLHYGFHVQPSV